MDDKALRRAKNIAYHFLAARPRSLAEVYSRLEKKEVPPDTIEKAVLELKGFGYIDDAKFAASYARHLIETKGLSRYALRYELKKKGVGEDDIDAALDGLLEADVEDEEAVARRLAEKKAASLRNIDREKARRRLTDYLRRKGYSFEVIRKATGPLFILLLLLTSCSFGYGPPVDRSRFISAKLTDDGTAAIFTAQRLVYRPAAGWRAFPDGGIPKYLVDENIIGSIGLRDKKPRILCREKNRYWQDGQGTFFISHLKGGKAVITQSGQRRSDYMTEGRFYLAGLQNGDMKGMALKEDFSRFGREVGYFYMLDGEGTLLFVNVPLGASPDNDMADNELWLRYPSGEYFRVASGADYYGFEGGELVYWTLTDRTLRAFDIRTRAVRELDRRDFPATQDVTLGVQPSSDGKTLEFSEKTESGWRVKDTLLEIGQLD